MNKNLQIFLVVLLFFVCGVVGYFLGEFVFEDTDKEIPEVSVVIEQPKSKIPVILNDPLVPQLNGRYYSLDVNATVESGDGLLYSLTTVTEPYKEIQVNNDGKFDSISFPSKGNEYRVVVYNIESVDSTVRIVPGFERITKILNPITKDELQRALNNVTDSEVPKSMYSRFSVQQRVVGRDGKAMYGNFAELWNASYVLETKFKIHHCEYDDDNKLVKVVAEMINVE